MISSQRAMQVSLIFLLSIFLLTNEGRADLVSYAEPLSAYKSSAQESLESPKVLDKVSAMVLGKTKTNYHMNIVTHAGSAIDMTSTPVINLPNGEGTTLITTDSSKRFKDSMGNTYVGSPVINGNINGTVFLINTPVKN